MSKSLLVTGSDGFTGRHFCRLAQLNGYRVEILQADLRDPLAVHNELSNKQFEFVAHFAAISSVTHANEFELYQVNLQGTENLLSTLAQLPVAPEKVVVASSANVYGNSASSPIAEDSPLVPENHYAMSKLAMEFLVASYHDRLPIVTARPFNYTGVGHDARFLIPKLIAHFAAREPVVELGNINVEREFNDVRSVCSTYLKMLNVGKAGEIYNICSGQAYSLSSVIALLEAISGHTIEVRINPDFVRENEVHQLCGDPSKWESCADGFSNRKSSDNNSAVTEPEIFSLNDTLQWMLDEASAATR